MKKARLLILMALLITGYCSGSPADTGHSKLTGVYRTYSGGLGDPGPPTMKDTKIMFSVEGIAARQMFDAMTPDVKDDCTEGTGIRIRKKDKENLVCTRTRQGEYSCNFGFDLKTGKSIGGIVC